MGLKIQKKNGGVIYEQPQIPSKTQTFVRLSGLSGL